MDFSSMFDSLRQTLEQSLPSILLALGVLIVGWIEAVSVRGVLRRALGLLKLNERVRSEADAKLDLEGGLARVGYYIVLTFTLVVFFNVLDLPLVSRPLESMIQRFLDFVPNLLAGGVLALVAWIVATVVRKLVGAALSATTLDDKLSEHAGMRPMSETLGNVLYGLVLLLFLPAVLGTLKLEGLLSPIQQMVDEILGMLPNVLAALVLGFVGWFVARLLRNLVTNLLEATGADQLGKRAGLQGTMSLSRLVGLVVFILIFVPALIAALNALQIEVISQPATEMLSTLLGALPDVFAAAVILAVAFLISDLVGQLITNLLGGLGFDRLPGKLGMKLSFGEGNSPSRLVGRIVVFFIVLFAVIEAADVLGFSQVSELSTMFLQFGGEVLLGLLIIAMGLWISNMAHAALSRIERPNADFMAGLARVTILGLVFAMGLRAMGIADDIVNLAFGLTLGAVAVAVALSFGLGGREAAGKQMEHWLGKMRGER
jgi:hypothetical protein